MPMIIINAMARLVCERWARAAAWAVLVILIIVALGVAKCSYDGRIIETHDAKVTQKTLRTDAAANDAAADQRAKDAISNDTAAKERKDAIEKAAPGRPSGAAVRLGCERLRQAGQDTSGIAACS